MADPSYAGIVIDNGSGSIKAGFSGDDAPRSVFRCCVGKPREEVESGAAGGGGGGGGSSAKETFVGREAEAKRDVLDISHPIVKGQITNWDDMEKVWHHTFYNELRVTPREYAVLLTESPSTSTESRDKLVELMFEKFDVPALYVNIQAVLSLYATGHTTGCVIDAGYGVTHTVPVYEGYALPHAIMSMDVAGCDLTAHMSNLLEEGGHRLPADSREAIVENVKQTMTTVALDYDQDMKTAAESHELDKPYTLPDGRVITLASERFRCPEVLFQPALLHKDTSGMHDTAFQTIMKCDVEIRKDLYSHIVLAGGSTMFPKIGDRVHKEITALAPSTMKINVVAPPQRKHSCWIGGSILSALASFQQMWVTKKEYAEHGTHIVHYKCF